MAGIGHNELIVGKSLDSELDKHKVYGHRGLGGF